MNAVTEDWTREALPAEQDPKLRELLLRSSEPGATAKLAH